MRKSCEKGFHSYVETSAASVQKRDFPEPDSHEERWETLDKIGEQTLIEIGNRAFLYLHQYGYYGGKIRPEVANILRSVKRL